MRTARSQRWVGRWGEGVGRFVEAISVPEPGGQMTLLEGRRENLKGA